MPLKPSESPDYKSLNSTAKNGGVKTGEQATLRPSTRKSEDSAPESLFNPSREIQQIETPPEPIPPGETVPAEVFVAETKSAAPEAETKSAAPEKELTYAEKVKHKREAKKTQKDLDLLTNDRWLARNGHTMSYIGLYLFSILVLYRPYELVDGLSFLKATAFYFALATLLIYLPTQFTVEGTLTVLSTEVKCILVLSLLALVTMPISKDPGTAWQTFNDTFSKAAVMFIVMVNVLRTRRRLMGVMWISLSVGLYLSYTALDMYWRGELNTEGYRVSVGVGGLFSNPNDLSLHLVMMMPLALCLALASKSKIMRWGYLLMTALFVGANTVTFSRGGFLGLMAVSGVLVWKLARKNRLNVSLASIVFGGLFILLAPGNYGVRILSIFGLAADPVGSSDQRRELLERSIVVSLRNPWGIGIGCFPIVGVRNLVTHNAYTQVSAELGLLGLAAYMVFMISPFRKLGAIERALFAKDRQDWFYYLSIGLQASIVGYMVSSFFVSVAYNWFIYYLIAYAVAFRRIYQIENNLHEEVKAKPLWEWKTAELK